MSTDVSVTGLEEVRELIAEGRELGAVAIARVADVVEAADLNEEQQERLLQVLAEMNIEVLQDGVDPPGAAGATANAMWTSSIAFPQSRTFAQ
mgnify:CR=1 FL=1